MTNKGPAGRGGLDERGITRLETFLKRLLRFFLYQLDEGFRLKPRAESNWPALGQTLIFLLREADARAFETVTQGMVHAMLEAEPPDNPYVAAAMAHTGTVNNPLFEEVVAKILGDSQADGSLPFGSKKLGGGLANATLWNVRLLQVSGKDADNRAVVESALNFLESGLDELLKGASTLLAGFLSAALHLKGERGEALARRCVEGLLARLGR